MHGSLPKNILAADGVAEDDIIATARDHDMARETLFAEWVRGGRQGPNPDSLPKEEVCQHYRAMIARERAAAREAWLVKR